MLSLPLSPFTLRLGLALTTFTTVCLLYTTFRTSPLAFRPPTKGMIVHIVMFQYAPEITAQTKEHVAASFVALKDACRLPDGSNYIASIDGGLNNSPEGRGKGMDHAYVVTFRNAAEREYYLDTDPAHVAFKTSIADKVSDVLVFDFESGEFERNASRRRRRPSDEIHVRTV